MKLQYRSYDLDAFLHRQRRQTAAQCFRYDQPILMLSCISLRRRENLDFLPSSPTKYMKILLTNDDGFHAPGINALHRELAKLGQVTRIAPATEQSGVGHSITFLAPLIAHRVFEEDELLGWIVEGSPADCVKLGVTQLCDTPPDIIVSGINGGLNAGINVLYSGTVAGAIEGAFFGITSFAVSLEFDEKANFARAAQIARGVVDQILQKKSDKPQLFNINIPTAATSDAATNTQLRVVPMGTNRYGEYYIKRSDPKGRDYYWATNEPPPKPTKFPTDLTELFAGHVTLTPLDFNMTSHEDMPELVGWNLSLPSTD